MPAAFAMSSNTFPQLLRRHRQAARLTQDELAGRARIGVRTLRELERGRAMPQRATAELLATALGLTGTDRDVFLRAARAGRRVATAPTSGRSVGADAATVRYDVRDAVAALISLVEKVDDPQDRGVLLAELSRVCRPDAVEPAAVDELRSGPGHVEPDDE